MFEKKDGSRKVNPYNALAAWHLSVLPAKHLSGIQMRPQNGLFTVGFPFMQTNTGIKTGP